MSDPLGDLACDIADEFFEPGADRYKLRARVEEALRASAEAARREAVAEIQSYLFDRYGHLESAAVMQDFADASEANEALLDAIDMTTDLAALKEAVVEAAAADYSDALAMCGGDGLGCDMYRKYHPRRCSECPMHLSIIEPCAALVAAQQKDPTP